MNKHKISAIVCAAGSSKRMGSQNKLLLQFYNKPLIVFILTQLMASKAFEIIVVLGYQHHKILKELDDYREHFIPVLNRDYTSGQTSSIQTGAGKMSEKSKAIMVCLSDMPLLRTHHYNEVMDKYEEGCSTHGNVITRPMCENLPGHPVIIDRVFVPDVLSCKDKDGCRSVLQNQQEASYHLSSCEQAYYQDVDVPGDIRKISI